MNSNPTDPTKTNTVYLTRPEGRICYDIDGSGPLVVLVPGMGDLRAAYRFLAPALHEAGYRVACTDLRGHGDSDHTFSCYGDVETAGDILALIEELGGPAVVAGNSMGAGAAALSAALQPELVSGLVLIGPFVRNGEIARSSVCCSGSRWRGRGRRPHGRPTCPSSTRASGRSISPSTATASWPACAGRDTRKRSP